MAVEVKLINRCLHPVLARFAAQSRFLVTRSRNHIQLSRNFSHRFSNYPQSKFLVTRPSNLNQLRVGLNDTSNLTQQSKSFNSNPITLTGQNSCDPKDSAKYFITESNNSSILVQRNSHKLLFRPIDPPKHDVSQDLLQTNKNTLEYLKGFPKSFFFRRKDDGKKPKKRIPKLILIQNPFTWLMIKIDFSVLRNIWDPSFKEKDFKYGTKQAISKVTNVISEGQYTELNGLLTKAARLSLMRELDRNWSEKQRSLLALKLEDIQITSPRKVYFIRIADKKYCDVDMAFLALKWAPINSIEALIFTEIFARFHREYTPHSIPEWTIAYFKVTRFEVLRRKPKTA